MWTDIEIRQIAASEAGLCARISSRFRVATILQVTPIGHGLGGLRLTEAPVAPPYEKDYDAIEGGSLTAWAGRFDTANCLFLLASDGEAPVGGAIAVCRTPGIEMLAGRDDLVVLWDLRVHPDRRRQGIGTRLFQSVMAWARERACRQLQVETQNVNVPACRFYAAQGCHLSAIDRHAYQGCPAVSNEAMLIWYLDL